MTHDDVVATASTVTVRLGRMSTDHSPRAPCRPYPFAARAAPADVGVDDPGRPSWLFPGQQAGRPMYATAPSPSASAGSVSPVGVTRRAALAHLTASMPAAVVADLLGVHATTAFHVGQGDRPDLGRLHRPPASSAFSVTAKRSRTLSGCQTCIPASARRISARRHSVRDRDRGSAEGRARAASAKRGG